MSRIGSTTNFHQPDRRRMTCKYWEQAVTSFQKKWQRLVVADLAIVKSGIQKKQNGQIKKKEEE